MLLALDVCLVHENLSVRLHLVLECTACAVGAKGSTSTVTGIVLTPGGTAYGLAVGSSASIP